MLDNFDSSLLENDPPEVADQLIFLHSENMLLKEAIKDKNYSLIEILISKGVPYSSDFFIDEIQELINPVALQAFDEEFMNIFKYTIPHYIIKDKEHELSELLAKHFILRTDTIYSIFRNDYFSITQEKNTAIEYLKNLLTYSCLKKEKKKWIESLLYNENHDFFKDCFYLYQQCDDITDKCIEPLTSCVFNPVTEQYINQLSFELYYHQYFAQSLNYQLNISDYRNLESYTQTDAIHYLFYKMLAPKFRELGKVDTLHTQNIISFLFSMYKSYYPNSIDDISFFYLCLKYWNIKDVDYTNQIMDKKSFLKHKIIANQNSQLNSLKNNRKIEAIDSMLKILHELIEKNSPGHCYKQFKKININIDYYPELHRYVQLNKTLNTKKKDDDIKKI